MAEAAAASKPPEDNAGTLTPPVAASAKAAPAKAAAKPAADAGRAWPDENRDPGRLAKPLAVSRCALLEHMDPGYSVCLERGTPYEAVWEPSFWANFAMWKKIQPGQTVHVSNDEQSFFAVLKVLDCGRNWAVMGQFHFVSRDAMVRARPPLKQRPKHIVQWAGPIDKFRVLREADNAVIKTGFDSELAATTYVADYERRLGV